MEMFDKSKIQPLKGWKAVADVAIILGRKRTRVHQMIEESKFNLEELRVVGDKKIILISEAGIKRMQALIND